MHRIIIYSPSTVYLLAISIYLWIPVDVYFLDELAYVSPSNSVNAVNGIDMLEYWLLGTQNVESAIGFIDTLEC